MKNNDNVLEFKVKTVNIISNQKEINNNNTISFTQEGLELEFDENNENDLTAKRIKQMTKMLYYYFKNGFIYIGN